LVSFPSIGILGPLTITNSGTNYAPGDRINFTGGSGLGAYGRVLAVDPGNGAIMQVEYTYDPANVVIFPKGGIGYQYALPSVSVASTSGHGAVLTIPGLVGGDATFNVIESPYGQVQEITLSNLGKDYISSPGVSLRVEDMLITNVNQFNKPVKGDVLYQGNISLPTAVANVDSLVVFSANTSNAFSSVYTLRVYDYGGTFNANAPLYFSRNGTDIGANVSLSQQTTGIYTNGRKIYGNGAARAKANFLNGIVLGAGIYENSDGQPSAYSILQDEKYNNYTYILQVQAALAKYKEAALSFLHPAGMNYFALNTLKNANTYNLMMTSKELDVQPLSYLLGGLTSYVGTFSPANGNVIDFDSSLSGANLANVVFANSYLTYHTTNGGQFYSKITGVTPSTITLQDSYITQVPNVVTATVASSDVIINTTGLTKAWSVATGNTVSHISDFISIYDQVSFDGVTYKTVVHVDDITSGNSIIVNTTFGAAQSGYLTLSKNTHSSNIFVSGFVSEIETIDLMTELGVPLTTEDMRIILLG
jgi:hypothetical protein